MNAEAEVQMALDQADKLFAAHPGVDGHVEFPGDAPISAAYFVADDPDDDQDDDQADDQADDRP